MIVQRNFQKKYRGKITWESLRNFSIGLQRKSIEIDEETSSQLLIGMWRSFFRDSVEIVAGKLSGNHWRKFMDMDNIKKLRKFLWRILQYFSILMEKFSKMNTRGYLKPEDFLRECLVELVPLGMPSEVPLGIFLRSSSTNSFRRFSENLLLSSYGNSSQSSSRNSCGSSFGNPGTSFLRSLFWI